ncbi:MAG: serine hydrolase [Betaproteobacteria bacterium]|nr:serine hydrolase [Betaproteobacteria bacterium]
MTRSTFRLGVVFTLLCIVGLPTAQAARHHRHHSSAALSGKAAKMAVTASTVLVIDQTTHQVVYSKNPDPVHPIASITKLMTAMVVLKSGQNLKEQLTVTQEDVDTLRFSHSHLRVGAHASRLDFLRMALIASENRAASALGRSYPGGIRAFVARMNEEAAQLGMKNTHFEDSSGLNSENVSTAHDLAILVGAASKYPLIREITTTAAVEEPVGFRGRRITFRNTNPLVSKRGWEIGLSKTGFINESGQCLVMQATINSHPMVIVLLNAHGHHARFNDATRVRKWLEAHNHQVTVGQL